VHHLRLFYSGIVEYHIPPLLIKHQVWRLKGINLQTCVLKRLVFFGENLRPWPSQWIILHPLPSKPPTSEVLRTDQGSGQCPSPRFSSGEASGPRLAPSAMVQGQHLPSSGRSEWSGDRRLFLFWAGWTCFDGPWLYLGMSQNPGT